MAESEQLLERLRLQREQRMKRRLNESRVISESPEITTNGQTEEIEEEDNEEDDVHIETSVLPPQLGAKPKIVYYSKSTATEDLQDLDVPSNESDRDQAILRKQMELDIRAQLESEYQKLYSDLVKGRTESKKETEKSIEGFKPKTYHESVIQKLSELKQATTIPSFISETVDNKILTVHPKEKLVCVWELGETIELFTSIQTSVQVTVAQFINNTQSIIIGSQMGLIHLYTYDTQFNAYLLLVQSPVLLPSPIVFLLPSPSDTVTFITQKAEIITLAYNLNDTIAPLKCVMENLMLTQVEVIDNSRVLLGDIRGDVFILHIGSLEIKRIFQSNALLPVMSMKYRPTSISGVLAINNLDTSIHIIDINTMEFVGILSYSSFVSDMVWVNDELVIGSLKDQGKTRYEYIKIDGNRIKSLKKIESDLVSRIRYHNGKLIGFKPDGNAITF